MNAEPEHTGEELIRLRAENRSLAADLYLAKKEALDWKEYAERLEHQERFPNPNIPKPKRPEP